MIGVDRFGEGVTVKAVAKRNLSVIPKSAKQRRLRRNLYWYALTLCGVTQQEISEDSGFCPAAVSRALDSIDRLAGDRSRKPELLEALRDMADRLESNTKA